MDISGRVDVDVSDDLGLKLAILSQPFLVPVLIQSQVMSVGIYSGSEINFMCLISKWINPTKDKLNHLMNDACHCQVANNLKII